MRAVERRAPRRYSDRVQPRGSGPHFEVELAQLSQCQDNRAADLRSEAESADRDYIWTTRLQSLNEEPAPRRANLDGKPGGAVADADRRVDGLLESVGDTSANSSCGHALCANDRWRKDQRGGENASHQPRDTPV